MYVFRGKKIDLVGGPTVIFNSMISTNKYIRNAEGKFVCPHCSVIKAKQNTMLYHIQSKHEKKFQFTCTKCSPAPEFLQKCGWLHHLATVHPDDPHPSADEKNPYAGVKYTCPIDGCGHTTHTRGNANIHFIRNHLKNHIPSWDKDIPCTGCFKMFQSSGAYLYHAADCFKDRIPQDQTSILSRIA